MLYVNFGMDPAARWAYMREGQPAPSKPGAMRRAWDRLRGKGTLSRR